jgi:hypothetical protein
MAKKDLQGTLDLLVLKTLAQRGEMHGYGIVLHVQKASDELLAVRRVPCTRRSTAWSRADGSSPTGR